MTHDDDARVADLLARLGDGDTKELFRRLLEAGMQDLIDAELTAAIGAAPHERTDVPDATSATDPGPGCCPHRLVTSSCGSRRCGSGRSSRRCWSRAVGSTRPCGRVIMTAYVTGTEHPQGRRPGPRVGLRVRSVEVDRVSDLRRDRRRSRRVPQPPPRPRRLPLRVPGRHLHQGPDQPPHRLPRRRRGHRRHRRTATARCSASMSATPRTKCSGRRSCAASRTVASPGCAS